MAAWYQNSDAQRAWDALPHGVCLIDRDDVVLFWNAALTALTKVRAAEIVGRSWTDGLPGWRESPLAEALRRTRAYGECETFTSTACCRRKVDPSTGPTTTFVVRPCGSLQGPAIVTISRGATLPDGDAVAAHPSPGDETSDVVEARRLLELQTHELRRKNQELHEARDRAELATRAKSEFLANMSHEIRTPMTAILGFSELLLFEEGLDRAPPERRRAIETIQRNGEHLLAIINDVLDVSKIESGKMSVEIIPCSPFQIIEEAVALMHGKAAAKGLRLVNEYRFPLPARIHSDPMRIRQILLNLVSNAVKFTESGSIRIRTAYLADPTPRLTFDVIDTGIGIDPRQGIKLFQPFSQADTSTTRRFGGSGLGLTICKRMAELLGGGIAFSSAPGCGSTFTVWIDAGPQEGVPLRYCERGEHPTPQSPPPLLRRETDRAITAAMPFEGCRFLLAEDGPDNQRLIAFILQKAGAEVEVVEDGRAAVEASLNAVDAGRPFDLVLMDMQMPVMDGYEATTMLRRCDYTRPIVALTANAMSGDRERCLDAGCDDFATKPIDRTRLFEIIAKAVARGRNMTHVVR